MKDASQTMCFWVVDFRKKMQKNYNMLLQFENVSCYYLENKHGM